MNLDTGYISIKLPQIGLCSWSLLLPPTKEPMVWKNLDGLGQEKYNAFENVSVHTALHVVEISMCPNLEIVLCSS